jgi:hypothetical protein
MTEDADQAARQAVAWINEHVARDQQLVIDSGLWVDLVARGFTNPRAIWLYKTETDAKVAGELGGWRGIDYIAVSTPTLDPKNRSTFPMVFEAKDHARPVRTFGTGADAIMILKVIDEDD